MYKTWKIITILIIIVVLVSCDCIYHIPYAFNNYEEKGESFYILDHRIETPNKKKSSKYVANQYICRGTQTGEIVRVALIFGIDNSIDDEIAEGNCVVITKYNDIGFTSKDTIWIATTENIEENYRGAKLIFGEIRIPIQ